MMMLLLLLMMLRGNDQDEDDDDVDSCVYHLESNWSTTPGVSSMG